MRASPGLCHKLTLRKHKTSTKQKAQRKCCALVKKPQQEGCVCCVGLYVFTQMATLGIRYQLHLLPRSLFASDMAWLKSAHFSCLHFDWLIRYGCGALIGGCCWNLKWASDQEEVENNSAAGNLFRAFYFTVFPRKKVLMFV